MVSSTSARRASAASRRFGARAVARADAEQVVEVRVEAREVGAAQRGGVAGAQVRRDVAQDVEQLAVAGGLAVAEELAADDVDRQRHAGADLAQHAGIAGPGRLVAGVGVDGARLVGRVSVFVPAKT